MTIPVLKIKVLPKPVLKGKMDVRFPANVRTEKFLTITRANGVYTFDIDYSLLTSGPILDPATAYIAVNDHAAGLYKTVTLASLLTSGLDADLQAIAALTGGGILARTADDTWALRTITGTANEITVTNGDGVSGPPTVSLPAALTFTGKTVAGGTFSGSTIEGGTVGGLTAFGILTTGTGTFDLTIGTDSNLTADRHLNIKMFDADRFINLAGNISICAGGFATVGDFDTVLTVTASTNVNLPTAGTLATLSGTETLTNKTLTSPVMTTPVLGTPVSGTLTNATGLPISTGVSGLGTGIASWLATPSSANLRAALTDETGTGAAVFGTSPNITTPTGIVKGDVGLGNVDNTSDATKWAATKTLTNTTYDTAGTGNSFLINGVAATANTGTGAVVRAVSPALTGTPTAPTASASDNSTKIATTAYVDAQVAGGVAGVASFKGRTGTVVPAQGDYPASLIPGTTTNDNATAGNIGEYTSSTRISGSALSLTNSTQTNVTNVSLTAGDWDVWGVIAFNTAGSTVVSVSIGSVSTTSATLGSIVDGGYFNVPGDLHNVIFPTGTKRISLASTTTVYLVAYSAFATSTQSVYGSIFARRVR